MLICHITSAHRRDDIRIFQKECKGLQKAGYIVNLLVSDGLGNEITNNITITDIGRPKNRIHRVTFHPFSIFLSALKINADIYHFHDPELILVGLLLQFRGKAVIYDVHESWSDAMVSPSRSYLPLIIRKTIGYFFSKIERFATRQFSGIITATPKIYDDLKSNSKLITIINNFPLINEFWDKPLPSWDKRLWNITYIGGIGIERGLNEMIETADSEQLREMVQLKVAGPIRNSLRETVKHSPSNVEFLGNLSRDKLVALLLSSRIGLLLLHETPNHLESQPIKLFEYMAAGLPVIASNFPYWQNLLRDYNCAKFVNPHNKNEIIKCIKELLNNDTLSEEMGLRGRNAVKTHFSWSNEEVKLIKFYELISK